MTRKEYIHGHADNPVVDKLLWLVHGDIDLLTEAVVACSKEVYERPHWYSIRKRRRWAIDLQDVTNWIIKYMREQDERSSTS